MIQLFRAFIDEVAHRGVKGLAELIAPQLGKAVDFFQGVREKYAKRKALRDQKAEAETIARMSAEQVVADIREEVRRAFPTLPKLREEVELYLSLAPGAVQRSLRGRHDPNGHSAPAGFALDSAEKVAAMFPAAVPTLRPNGPVPGREEKYRLVAPVGGGGFGEVWKAADLMRPNHFVAVKVFPDPNVKLDVIRHEYRQALRLNDPRSGWPAGVVPVVDAELRGAHPWIMYEFVGGGTLAELIVYWQTLDAAERMQQALRALKSLAGTCAHMHALDPALVHRDLKPANVLWDAAAKALRITDLGLGGAAVQYELATESRGLNSRSGRLPSMLFGSFSQLYASPEQKLGGPPNPRDDVHALGVIGYQILTGALNAAPGPDAAEELAELQVPKPLARLLIACTASNPARRPENATAVLEEIGRFTKPRTEPVTEVAEPEEEPRPPKRRRKEAKRQSEPARRVVPDGPARPGWRIPVIVVGSLLAVAGIVYLVSGFFGGVGDARQRTVTSNNLRQIGISFHIYNDTHKCFPPAAVTQVGQSKEKQPVPESELANKLSWRVGILPYLDEGSSIALRFRLDEQWDSAANRPMASTAVRVFSDPDKKADPDTRIRVFYGPNAPFNPVQDNRLDTSAILDGSSQTIFVAESRQKVTWTRFGEMKFDEVGPPDPKSLGREGANGFNALFFDGHVTFIRNTVSRETLKRLITHQEGVPTGFVED